MSRRLQQIHVQAREGGRGLNQKQRLNYLVSVNTLLYWQSVSDKMRLYLIWKGRNQIQNYLGNLESHYKARGT